ncbi:GNAT family N-acetyltransferase [Anaerostipes sp.]|uniref:GNAT family N-acetyltransferase n=1 Tax=Anaerostipes sp. TaxID=1872530 RepID=UPI0025BB0493|nr:GNAT family N-acetyltransferase [Anaerostipes sp.]MBS7008524.1 GNAT family N-acetyltransferase [Anaerostipes sp.]
MEIKVCKTDEQIQALAELASEIWHEYFVSIISKEQIDYMVEKFQSYHALKKAIKEEQYTYFLGYDQGELAGFCGVKPDGDRLFLSKLYLHKDQRGKGSSSILLKRALAFAAEHGKRAVYLTCNKYNQNSLEIYKAKGFKTIDSVKTDIGNGFIMDDYVMQMDL